MKIIPKIIIGAGLIAISNIGIFQLAQAQSLTGIPGNNNPPAATTTTTTTPTPTTPEPIFTALPYAGRPATTTTTTPDPTPVTTTGTTVTPPTTTTPSRTTTTKPPTRTTTSTTPATTPPPVIDNTAACPANPPAAATTPQNTCSYPTDANGNPINADGSGITIVKVPYYLYGGLLAGFALFLIIFYIISSSRINTDRKIYANNLKTAGIKTLNTSRNHAYYELLEIAGSQLTQAPLDSMSFEKTAAKIEMFGSHEAKTLTHQIKNNLYNSRKTPQLKDELKELIQDLVGQIKKKSKKYSGDFL